MVTTPGLNAMLDYCRVPHVEARWVDVPSVVAGLDAVLVVGDYSQAWGARELSAIRPDLWVLRIGRNEPFGAPVLRTEGPGACWPILVLDDHEILSRADARADLGIDHDRPLTFAVPSLGRPGYVERMTSTYDLVLDRVPALRWMRAADRIVGCCGYLWTEVTALGIPATWFALDDLAPDQVRRLVAVAPPVVPFAAARAAASIDDLADGLPWVDPTLRLSP